MCGHYEMLKARQERIVACNPQCSVRITGKEATKGRLKAALAFKPPPIPLVYKKGRYIPKSIQNIIDIVADVSGLTVETITGFSRKAEIVNARFVIANLSEEFCPHLGDRAVDDAMLRGHGMSDFYRNRHRERCRDFPEYVYLYDRCREAVEKAQ